MDYLIINGVSCVPLERLTGSTIRLPSEMQVTIQSYDGSESGRTGDGTMHRDYVCDKRRIDVTWKVLSTQEMALLLSKIDPNTAGPKFNVRYLDPEKGVITISAYVGDRVAAQYTFTDNKIAFKDFSIGLIEY